MYMMDKLLSNLNRVWNTLPKDLPMLTLRKSNGTHALVTVTGIELTFHSATYRSDMPAKQSVALDGYTLTELVQVINSMGYSATLTQQAIDGGFGSRKATILMTFSNTPIGESLVLTGFTSNLWQFLYPFARVLRDLDTDTDSAIQQMYAMSTSGTWADYWAGYFKIRRLLGESDLALQKRIFIAITNMKTNNVALQQLLQYAVGGSVEIKDTAPAQFEIDIDPSFMTTSANVRQIVEENKGAGIDYILNYLGFYEEDFRAYFKDTYGMDFQNSDKLTTEVSMPSLKEASFQLGSSRFTLGSTHIGTGSRILQKRIRESLSMELTVDGVTVRKETIPV